MGDWAVPVLTGPHRVSPGRLRRDVASTSPGPEPRSGDACWRGNHMRRPWQRRCPRDRRRRRASSAERGELGAMARRWSALSRRTADAPWTSPLSARLTRRATRPDGREHGHLFDHVQVGTDLSGLGDVTRFTPMGIVFWTISTLLAPIEVQRITDFAEHPGPEFGNGGDVESKHEPSQLPSVDVTQLDLDPSIDRDRREVADHRNALDLGGWDVSRPTGSAPGSRPDPRTPRRRSPVPRPARRRSRHGPVRHRPWR